MTSKITLSFLNRCILFGLLAVSALLASCGAGTIYNAFVPTRVVVFGDALSDITTNAQYTVNGDGSINNWTTAIASNYGVSTANVVSYAKGNACISNNSNCTNAVGFPGAAVTSVTQQVNNFLASDSFKAGDLVLVNAGFTDLLTEAGTTNSLANAKSYGNTYANLIRTIVTAGAKHVLAANVYDLSRIPAASIQPNLATTDTNARSALVAAFNDQFKINLGSATLPNVGSYVALVDTEYYMDLVIYSPNTYAFNDATTIACSSIDSGPGIGLGSGQINSKLCTASTISTAATVTTYNALAYDNYVFADAVYPTPIFHSAFGFYVFGISVSRW